MRGDVEAELATIREIQADLRWKLQSVDRRIKELESRVAKSVPAEEAPPPPVVATVRETFPAPPPIPVEVPAPAPEPEIPTPPVFADPPHQPEQAVSKDSLEMRLGRVWLVRVGIVLLLTGLVFLGNFAWQEVVMKLGAGGKLAMIYLAGMALAAIGWFCRTRSPQLRNYGNVLAGGGIATIYYATYAAHFVDPLRVIANPLVGGILLLLVAAGIIALAVRLKLESIASITTALSFYTSAINPVAGFSLFSNLVLSLVAITLLVRQRWTSVSFVSLAGCYLGFAFWRFHQTGTLLAVSVEDADVFRTALLFPACYWVVFTVATFLGRAGKLVSETRAVFLTLNNGAFFGLTAPLFAGNDPGQLWLFTLAFGLVLVALAYAAARRSGEEKVFDASYLVQGLGLISLGFLFKFSSYQAAIVFALQSGTLMKMSRLRHGAVFQFFSGVAAVLAAWFSLSAIARDVHFADVTAVGVAVALTATAWLFKAQRARLSPISLQWRAGAFVALATFVTLAAVFHGTSGAVTLGTLIALSLLGTVSVRFLKLPELVYAAQVFAMAILVQWLIMWDGAAVIPAASIFLSALALMHWWQHQTPLPVSLRQSSFWQILHASIAVLVLLVWTLSRFALPLQLPLLAALALLLLGYGFLTKAWPLLIVGQLFSFAFLFRYLECFQNREHWMFVVLGLALYALQSPVVGRWQPSSRKLITIYRRFIEFTATFGAILAVYVLAPAPWLCLTLAVFAFVFFGGACLRKNSVFLWQSAMFLVPAAFEFLRSVVGSQPAFWPDFAAPLLLLLSQQWGSRRLSDLSVYPRTVSIGSIIAGVLGIWILLSDLISATNQGFLLTISWAVLASVSLTVGFVIKERTYRLFGLGILAAAVGRIFLIDIWQLDTIYRILSFLVLGALLLAAGFLYNRFAEVIRKLI